MERKLASIQKVLSVDPISGADNIEGITVLGWHLVSRKGEFKVGDHCVYCECDSILPDKPWTEFLKGKLRIKTIKLKGSISQGIAFPLSILPLMVPAEEGYDVTELLGVTKYDPPEVGADLHGKAKGNFPGFLIKTDETRIQSVPGVLDRHRDKLFYITEKLDGTSFTCYLRGDEFGVCNRSKNLCKDANNLYWNGAMVMNFEGKLLSLGRDLALQGELLGPRIQGNKYKLSAYQIRIFDIFDINAYKYFNYNEFVNLCTELNILTVPILDHYTLLPIDTPATVDHLVNLSMGLSELNREQEREGMIIRSMIEDTDPELGRLSFKVINPRFLLKHKR